MSVRPGAGGAFLRERICETYDSVTFAARARSRWSRSSSSSRWRITRATSILNCPPLIAWAECAYKLTKIVQSATLGHGYSLPSLRRIHRQPGGHHVPGAVGDHAAGGAAQRVVQLCSRAPVRAQAQNRRAHPAGTASPQIGVAQLAAIAQRRGVRSSSIAGRRAALPVTSISNSEPIALAAWWSTAPAAIARLWSGAAASAKRPRSPRSDQRSRTGNRGNGRGAATQLHVPRDARQRAFRAGHDCRQNAQVSDQGTGGRQSDTRLVALRSHQR